jgi:hypothetical protein
MEARARLQAGESDIVEDFVTHAAACYDQARTLIPGRAAEGSAGRDAFTERVRSTLRAALSLPECERNFGSSWPVEARMVLPTHSPATDAMAVWGPVLAWCVAQALTTSLVSPMTPAAELLELFDRWRLRQAFASDFGVLGVEGDAKWRAAARVRILLARADRGRATADGDILTMEDWDGDVAWLTGLHTSEGCRYVVKEQFEQLLWWTQLPALLDAVRAGKSGKAMAKAVVERVGHAANAMRDAGYKPDVLLQVPGAAATCEVGEAASTSGTPTEASSVKAQRVANSTGKKKASPAKAEASSSKAVKKEVPVLDATRRKKTGDGAEAEGTQAELPPIEKPSDHRPNKHTHGGAKKKKST